MLMNISRTKNNEIMAIKNVNNKSSFLFFILFAIIVLFGAFSILQPKASSIIYEQKREVLLNDFKEDLKNNNELDTKKFWEFREFYSPGHFVYRRDGLSKDIVKDFTQRVDIPGSVIVREYFFLKFNSPRIESIESLSEIKSFDKIMATLDLKNKKVLKQGVNYILLEIGSNDVLLIFLGDYEDLKKTNGFFDYTEEDKALTEDKNWLVISLITTD
jgi:hypothetical protein